MTRHVVALVTGAAAVLPLACGGGAPGPASVGVGRDACANCRMTVSDPRLAAQIVAPGEEPRFFDDIGCLAGFLRDVGELSEGAAVYVADHRTGEWVPAVGAIYTRTVSLATPMGSGLVAHATTASRDDDADARGGAAVPPTEVFGPAGAPGATP